MKSKFGWYAIGIYFLVLVVLLIAVPFIRCTGEWCGLIPFGWAFSFWGNILLWISPDWYWSLESFPGFGIFVVALNVLTVYNIGALIGSSRQSRS